MYSFPVAAVTSDHKSGDLEQQVYFLTGLKARSPKGRYLQCWFLLVALMESPFHVPLLTSEGCGQSLAFLGF